MRLRCPDLRLDQGDLVPGIDPLGLRQQRLGLGVKLHDLGLVVLYIHLQFDLHLLLVGLEFRDLELELLLLQLRFDHLRVR